MATGAVAYDPNNATQNSFLSALAIGETSTTPWAAWEGVGGTNLSSASVDQYGFPEWSGFGNSHAAGTYQFQPGTWDTLAAKFGLNFQNPQDQNEGAWLYAQQVYSQKTGGSLTDALNNGDFTSIQSALSGVWPSVNGNGSSQGLAYNLANGIGANINTNSTGASQVKGTPFGATSGAGTSSSGSGIAGYFVRGGLIVVGVLILVVALWQLLSQNSSVPSPGSVAKSAVKFAET